MPTDSAEFRLFADYNASTPLAYAAHKNNMELNDTEKEMLGFLYGRIGHRANAVISLRELQQHFAEVNTGNFWTFSSRLIEKGLIENATSDEVCFSPEGWQHARALQGSPPIRNPRAAQADEATPPQNENLVWDLSRLADYERACRFVMHFRKSLCVYSAPVEQLYSNYDIVVPKDNERKLIILPNPQAYHDTFSFINADAVISTRMFITPNAEGALQLMIPLTAGDWRTVPLGPGLNLIQQKLGPDVPFLPVLTKGDLRELTPSQPVLHLHRVVLGKIRERSDMELRSIRRAIHDNLAEHFGFKIPGKVVLS